MNKVYCIGELLIDFVGTIQDEAKRVNIFEKKAGGAPANVAVAAKRFGADAYFLGQVGKDAFGTFLKETLEAEQVDVTYLKQAGQTTLAFVSLDADGERSFEFFRGGDGDYVLPDAMLEHLSGNDIIHFGSATAFLPGQLKASYFRLLELARAKKCIISFDPNYRDLLITDLKMFRDDCTHFMEVADLIKLSEEEATLLTKTDTLDQAIAQLRKKTTAIITITLGSKGTMVIFDKTRLVIPSIKIKAIDTTGAGDSFIGALLGQMANLENPHDFTKQETLQTLVKYANVVAALTCTKYGAIPALPTQLEVENKRGELNDVG